MQQFRSSLELANYDLRLYERATALYLCSLLGPKGRLGLESASSASRSLQSSSLWLYVLWQDTASYNTVVVSRTTHKDVTATWTIREYSNAHSAHKQRSSIQFSHDAKLTRIHINFNQHRDAHNVLAIMVKYCTPIHTFTGIVMLNVSAMMLR